MSSGNASYRCSMSSSADFSDEDDFSQKSGSASPAPGDTLPWNLPKHERSKRKIHGGSVLDPAERAVLRIAAAYLYVEEQEYLQAYEDVLERYKAWLLLFQPLRLNSRWEEEEVQGQRTKDAD
ncbi:microtubule-actin cross-linking factor 1, isoforms 1/2/3/5-like protein [Camelus ferus]|nr:microtubule-actin cross-linking factor 1, isoforms 1/2/3/5-like protein [Camelus ferus]